MTENDLNDLPADQVLSALEAQGLRHLMQRFDYNQSDVALALKMSRSTLRKRLRLSGLPTTSPRYLKRRTAGARLLPHQSTLRV